jgi:ubiquinone/menaquinone biosynthesis C-methylase UbiE
MNPSRPSEVAAAYNEWAATYDVVPNRTRDLAGDVLRHVNLKLANRTIIEVGCGTGRNTEWLSRSAASAKNIIGLDFSEQMLARARARVNDPRVRFLRHDVRIAWPLENASADVIIVMLVLEHVEHLQTIFEEAARTLTPGGQLFICELHPMRQLLGGQARFANVQTGELQLVPAFLHNVSDYVNAGLAAGLEFTQLGEWRDAEAAPRELPRLLSLTLRAPVRPLS